MPNLNLGQPGHCHINSITYQGPGGNRWIIVQLLDSSMEVFAQAVTPVLMAPAPAIQVIPANIDLTIDLLNIGHLPHLGPVRGTWFVSKIHPGFDPIGGQSFDGVYTLVDPSSPPPPPGVEQVTGVNIIFS